MESFDLTNLLRDSLFFCITGHERCAQLHAFLSRYVRVNVCIWMADCSDGGVMVV